MDDITAQLNQILSDPQSMSQIQGIMNGLGLGGNQSANSAPVNEPPKPATTPTNPLPDTEMLGMITKLAPLLGQIKQDDNTSRLLASLRPMLSTERQRKIDQAVKVLQLMKLFPLLKDSGMLSSILGGLF